MARFRMIREPQVQSATAAAWTANDVPRELEKPREGWLRLRLFSLAGVNHWVEVTAGWTFKYNKITEPIMQSILSEISSELPSRANSTASKRGFHLLRPSQQWWAQAQHVSNGQEGTAPIFSRNLSEIHRELFIGHEPHLACVLAVKTCGGADFSLGPWWVSAEKGVNQCMLGYFQLRSHIFISKQSVMKDTYVSCEWLTARWWMALLC